jgi:hypothetical protein
MALSGRNGCRITAETKRRPMGSLMDRGERADGSLIVRRRVEHSEELGTRLLIAAQLEQGAAERHSRRLVSRVLGQTGLAHLDGFLAVTGTAVLFRKLRKSNRRRILVNPASKILNSRVIRHA